MELFFLEATLPKLTTEKAQKRDYQAGYQSFSGMSKYLHDLENRFKKTTPI